MGSFTHDGLEPSTMCVFAKTTSHQFILALGSFSLILRFTNLRQQTNSKIPTSHHSQRSRLKFKNLGLCDLDMQNVRIKQNHRQYIKTRILSAKNAGKVWITETTRPFFKLFENIFSTDRTHTQITYCLPILLGGATCCHIPMPSQGKQEQAMQAQHIMSQTKDW